MRSNIGGKILLSKGHLRMILHKGKPHEWGKLPTSSSVRVQAHLSDATKWKPTCYHIICESRKKLGRWWLVLVLIVRNMLNHISELC